MKGTESKAVKLSVIVAAPDCGSSLENCLESIVRTACGSGRLNAAKSKNETYLKISKTVITHLKPSATADGSDKMIEIIVAAGCLKEEFDEWAERYSEIVFINFPPRTTLPFLLSAAIARSKGEIVAITDSSCIVADDWISSILKAHQSEAAVIGGAVEMSGNGGSLTDWSAYFCDYGQFMLPAERGAADAVPGNNLSIKRPALNRGKEFVEPEFWKTLWCRKLQSEGLELFFEPAILVNCHKNYKLIPFLARRFYQGRCFAGMRAAKFSGVKRVVYTIGTPLLPILALFRTISPVVRKNRHFGKLLLSMPVIVLAIVSWSAGEAAGYAAGTGNSCAVID